MRILLLLTELPYPPSRNGIALINYELLKLAPKDVTIDILITGCKEDSGEVDRLRAAAPAINNVHFTGEPLSRKYRVGNLISGVLLGRNIFTQVGVREYLKEQGGNIDVVYVAPLMAGVDFRLTRPLFLNAVDSFARLNENAYLRTGRLRDWLKMALYRIYERRVLAAASLINFVSDSDLESVRRGNPALPLLNVSNGIDSTVFTPDERQRVPGRLLFTGNFDYAPNRDAARHLALVIFPLIRASWPNVTLQLVGRNPPSDVVGLQGVMTTGFVDDIVACYRSAEVFVCPLLSGAGVKNKILEALSTGMPIVTTALGIEGIGYLQEDRHYLLAEEPHVFSQKVLRVLRDAGLRRSLGEQARSVATQHLGWQPISDRYYEALRRVAAAERGEHHEG